jgi:hypothetical protein
MRGRAQAHAAEGTIGNAMAQAAQTDRLVDLGQAGGGRGCAKAAWMIWPGMTAATDLNSNDSSASADELEAKLRGCGLSEAP